MTIEPAVWRRRPNFPANHRRKCPLRAGYVRGLRIISLIAFKGQSFISLELDYNAWRAYRRFHLPFA